MNPMLLWYIPLLPFVGFLINGTIGRRLPRAAVTGIALLFTAIPAAIVGWLWITMKAAGAPLSISTSLGPWIAITGFHVDFSLAVDHLTMIMLGVVTGVGFLIHLYSAGYMAHEDGYWRFFAYLNLFMFFMSVLVLAESFLLLFVGWEGVGLASYLLIGFYFRKKSAADAGKKAFHRQSHRRLRLPACDVPSDRALWQPQLFGGVRADYGAPGVARRLSDCDCAAAGGRRDG